MKPVRVEPYRWRLSGGFVAHLIKATTQHHHRGLAPTIAQLVPPEAVVFDVGAHAGQYAKLFARAASAGRVYAFEPGSYARAILRVVVGLHRLRNVAVLPLALGAECGVATLSVPVKRSGSYGFGLSHLGAPQDRWPVVAQELVGLTTIDTVATALALDRLDLIKADIEGWELSLLRGAENTLRRFRPRLLIELSETHLARAGETLDRAFAFLAGLGYAAFELEPKGNLVPVGAPRDGDFWFISVDNPAPGMR
jgi:FkbM family methyltransferase